MVFDSGRPPPQLGRVFVSSVFRDMHGIAVAGELYGRIFAAMKDPRAGDVPEQGCRAWGILGDTERAQAVAALIEELG